MQNVLLAEKMQHTIKGNILALGCRGSIQKKLPGSGFKVDQAEQFFIWGLPFVP